MPGLEALLLYLREAREDLERDEEIFAGKLADIEKYQGMIKALHRENRALKKARGGSESLPAEARRDGRDQRLAADDALSPGRGAEPETVTDDDMAGVTISQLASLCVTFVASYSQRTPFCTFRHSGLVTNVRRIFFHAFLRFKGTT